MTASPFQRSSKSRLVHVHLKSLGEKRDDHSRVRTGANAIPAFVRIQYIIRVQI